MHLGATSLSRCTPNVYMSVLGFHFMGSAGGRRRLPPERPKYDRSLFPVPGPVVCLDLRVKIHHLNGKHFFPLPSDKWPDYLSL